MKNNLDGNRPSPLAAEIVKAAIRISIGDSHEPALHRRARLAHFAAKTRKIPGVSRISLNAIAAAL